MKLTCNTIGDILPLVAEDLASEDTIKLVNEHIRDCPKCKKEFEEINSSKLKPSNTEELDSIPLKSIKKKLKCKNLYIGILTALIISLIFFIGFDKITKPIALSYDKVVESISEQNDLIL